jgi:hypothetical protein
MIKQIILSGTLIISGTINISSAPATEKPAGSAERIAPTENDTVETSRVSMAIVNRLPAEHTSIDARRPSQALMKEIIGWLSSNFDLPAIYDYPRIEFASAARLTFIRYNERAAGNARENSIELPVAVVEQSRDIVALYEDSAKTIILADDWSGATPADISVLVHEMVHHLQNLGRLVYECPPAREKLAYGAQELWLNRFGLDLENTFGVDRFTILVRSACIH